MSGGVGRNSVLGRGDSMFEGFSVRDYLVV